MTNHWIAIPQAAELAEVSRSTLNYWCKHHAIGRKIGGRWRVDVALLTEMLAGEQPAETTTTRRKVAP